MNKFAPILIIIPSTLVVMVLANLGEEERDAPTYHDTGVRSNDCASCHEGSVPNNHTVAFLEESHGCVARTHRESCMTCHAQKQCADCHDNEQPSWHNMLLCTPAGGERQRNEHMRIANQHRGSCMECHSSNFQIQCSTCHTMDEWKL